MAATAIELRRPSQLRDRRRAQLVRASDRMNRGRRELGLFRQIEGYLPLPDGIDLVRILSGYGSTIHAREIQQSYRINQSGVPQVCAACQRRSELT
jgi:hypothetical protein